jgi:hypothetical protein
MLPYSYLLDSVLFRRIGFHNLVKYATIFKVLFLYLGPTAKFFINGHQLQRFECGCVFFQHAVFIKSLGIGWIGQYLEPLGIQVAYTPIGITLALIFIGIPFVVRTVQPVGA